MARDLGLLVALAAQASDPAVIRHPDPPFELKLPKGYRQDPSPKLARQYRPAYPHKRSTGTADWEAIEFGVIVQKERLNQGHAPTLQEMGPLAQVTGGNVKTVKARWSEFELDVFEVRYVEGTAPVLVLGVSVPVSPGTITLLVACLEPLEKEAWADLRAMLLDLKAKTYWKTAEELRSHRLILWARWVTYGLTAAFPLAWLIFFRGYFMRAHLLRTLWLTTLGLSYLALAITGGPPVTLFGNPLVGGHLWYLLGPLVFLSLAGRRLKLAIDEGD